MNRQNKNKKDIKYILNHLREVDKLECIDTEGEDYKKTLFQKIYERDCIIGKYKNKAVIMGGVFAVDDNNTDIGCAWMLSTDEIVNHKLSLMKHLKIILEELDKKYFILCNYMHNLNIENCKYLERLGFVFGDIDGIPKRDNYTFFYRINPKMKGLN